MRLRCVGRLRNSGRQPRSGRLGLTFARLERKRQIESGISISVVPFRVKAGWRCLCSPDQYDSIGPRIAPPRQVAPTRNLAGATRTLAFALVALPTGRPEIARAAIRILHTARRLLTLVIR